MEPRAHHCPVCHTGTLTPITLMDVWGCASCHHLFEWGAEHKSITVIDRSPPLTWFWTGKGWRWKTQTMPAPNIGILVASLAVTLLPSVLIGIASYIFPPLPGSPLSWFPLFWQGLALVCHAGCVGWLLAEAYQWSPYVRFKLRLQHGASLS